jgi:CheY-like chemotaxis protein
MESKILIVDDEANNLEILVSMIEEFDHSVELLSFTDASKALEIAKIEVPDLIITDWEMPIMNGLELIAALQEDPITEDIPVIMCTGIMVSSSHLKQALDAGAKDFIRKPIDSVELEARLNSMLQLSQSQQLVRMQIKKLADEKARREDFLTGKLELKDRDISELAIVISHQKEMAERLLTRMKSLKKGTRPIEDGFRELIVELQVQGPDNETSRMMSQNIDQLNAEFFKRLHSQFPELTKSELELCGLTLMNQSTQSIALIRNVEINSIRKSRQRLRKKLGLSAPENLQLFLKSI